MRRSEVGQAAPARADGDGLVPRPHQPPITKLIDEHTPLLATNETAVQADGAGEQTVVAAEASGPRLALILGTVYVGVFLGAVDSSIMATLSGPISSEFRSLSLLSWLATAYLIANAACQPLSGRLTDIFGRGAGLVFSNVMFAAGNMVCGLARDQYAIIAGRVVAGVGGGGLMSIATFLASDLVSLRRRGLIQGVGNIAYGAGAMCGGVFGGLVNDVAGWRPAFLVQVPVVLVSAVMVFFLVKVPPKMANKSLVSRIDFTGGFLIVAFLVLLLLGLSAGGNLVPWTHPLVLTTIPVSLLLFAALIWWESRASQPIIPVRLLVDRTVLAACCANMACTMVLMMFMYYLPLYLQVLGHTPTQAALRLLASPMGGSIGSIGSGYLMNRTGRYYRLGIAVVALFAGGAAILATLAGPSSSSSSFSFSAAAAAPRPWVPFLGMFLLGAGYGGMLTVTLLACLAAVAHTHQAVITSATYAFRSVGATLGITVASAVYQNVLQARLWARFGGQPGAAAEIARIRDDLAELRHLPPGWYEGVMDSFADAFWGVWVTGLALAVVGLVCVSLMREHKLHSTLTRDED